VPSTRPNAEHDTTARLLWGTLAAITLWRLVIAWLLPVTQDEAYYFDWARSLAWGYFDHPPGVALLAIGSTLAPVSAFAGRLGIVLAATLTLFTLIRLYRACGLRGQVLLVALVVAAASVPGLATGAITNPDTALLLAWALALHEALAAVRGQRSRWITAGAVTGLGLLGKYTMVLIGPVFLWIILWADRKALRTPWPYLGGLAAFTIASPNLLWNASNDWVTFRFQFGHGFSTSTGALVSNPLPPPVDALTQIWVPEAAPTLGERLGGVLEYLGTQAAMWGFIVFPVIVALIAGLVLRLRGAPPARAGGAPWQGDPAARAVLVAGTWFPLGFFALIASVSDVEANWPFMAFITAAPLVAHALEAWPRSVLIAAGANFLLISLYALHGATGILPLPDSQQRILRETHGFDLLARKARELSVPVFADRYQTIAMIRFYEPSLAVTQWPGVTRPSEYLRGRIAPPVSLAQIETAGGFWLVSNQAPSSPIPGFRLRSRSQLFDCLESGLREVPVEAQPPCAEPLHRWVLLSYAIDARAESP
jgi:4-amino-4-deoxy-L-arabinose transferase-like glycosyltransferase